MMKRVEEEHRDVGLLAQQHVRQYHALRLEAGGDAWRRRARQGVVDEGHDSSSSSALRTASTASASEPACRASRATRSAALIGAFVGFTALVRAGGREAPRGAGGVGDG